MNLLVKMHNINYLILVIAPIFSAYVFADSDRQEGIPEPTPELSKWINKREHPRQHDESTSTSFKRLKMTDIIDGDFVIISGILKQQNNKLSFRVSNEEEKKKLYLFTSGRIKKQIEIRLYPSLQLLTVQRLNEALKEGILFCVEKE